jgi:hypothetical protein
MKRLVRQKQNEVTRIAVAGRLQQFGHGKPHFCLKILFPRRTLVGQSIWRAENWKKMRRMNSARQRRFCPQIDLEQKTTIE